MASSSLNSLVTSKALSTATTLATVAASLMFLRTTINDLIPHQLQTLILSKLKDLFSKAQIKGTIVMLEINQLWDDHQSYNQLFKAAKAYLPTRITRTYKSLKVGVPDVDDKIAFALNSKQEVVDEFEDMKLYWKLVDNPQNVPTDAFEKSTFFLSFNAKHRDRVINEYLPHVLSVYEAIKAKQRNVNLHYISSYSQWSRKELKHPATFETLAFEPELKQRILEDIERFLRRKELYKKVGKPWKRGYLLYGPPGTGKSSLVVAMANYLKFDVYNLELARLSCDSDLMKAMTDMSNRSIVVIEDIDCNKEVHTRDSDSGYVSKPNQGMRKFTLSSLLNYMDGLWSSSGEERIIVFTTNHVEKIDPALLRPGRMDMHINLTFSKGNAFRTLASNYLDIHGDHPLFQQIDVLLEKVQVTPAVIAEQLLRYEDSDVALKEFIRFLQHKDIIIAEADNTTQV
ncbi:AAA-ATPase [Senna tora]|uniref:AAA-ATPase n=1 Tax=Senna tora TaxID=362788 RepID=A0A834SVW3_9FABA|nr:AAA-ATPase [Senna tora]